MNKAWSFFWLVVAWCVGLSIIAAIIQPYLWVVALILFLSVSAYIGLRIWRSMSDRRSHF